MEKKRDKKKVWQILTNFSSNWGMTKTGLTGRFVGIGKNLPNFRFQTFGDVYFVYVHFQVFHRQRVKIYFQNNEQQITKFVDRFGKAL